MSRLAAAQIVLWFFVCSFVSVNLSLGKLQKAFEALQVYNYFEAKDLFYKSLKRHEAPASYGLSRIYGSDDNPFYNLDSAYKYIYIAETLYPSLNSNQLESYSNIGASSGDVEKWRFAIDSLFFMISLEKGTVESWENYIRNHKTIEYQIKAEKELHKVAFGLANETHTSSSYEDFINTYPEAEEIAQAQDSLDKAIFVENTSSGLIVDYQRFIEDYPRSPYHRAAELHVYHSYTKDENLDSYLRFITENPDNYFVSAAWLRIYALEIVELSPESIAAFTLKYPNYPYLDELQSEYDLIATKFLPVYDGSKWGFIDEYGTLKIDYRFDFVEHFTESLALVGLGDSVNYINKAGRFVSDVFFEEGFSFKRGFAVVMDDGFYGVINRLGNWVVEPNYSDVGEFSGGYFYVEDNENFGYADQNGSIVIDFRFSDANDFHQGRAVVAKDGFYGLINSTGEALSAFDYEWIDGFAAWPSPSRYKKEGLYGLIDLNGNEITGNIYDQIGEFKEGKALFASNGKYGFLSVLGDTLVKPLYTFSQKAFKESFFYAGHAKVFQGSEVAIIDSTGQKVYPAIFQDAGYYVGNNIPIKKRGKWGYANRDVDLTIAYQFDYAENFVDTLAKVMKNNQVFLIDTLANNILDTTYARIQFAGDFLIVGDTLFGLMSRGGESILDPNYTEVLILDGKYLMMKDQNGYVDYFNYLTNKMVWRQEEHLKEL